MIKSIKYFNEKCIKNFEKLENDFLREPLKMAEYVMAKIMMVSRMKSINI